MFLRLKRLILDEISRLDNVTTGSFRIYLKLVAPLVSSLRLEETFAGILTTGNILSYSLGSSKGSTIQQGLQLSAPQVMKYPIAAFQVFLILIMVLYRVLIK